MAAVPHTPGKDVRRAACTLDLKRFMQVTCTPTPVSLQLHCKLYIAQLSCYMLQAPILDFGTLKVGCSKTLELLVANLDQQQQVTTGYHSC